MALPDSFVEEVRRTADIVRYISEHVALRKAGTSWKGLCPFHNEKTPSFNVRQEPAVFHCFGCGQGGDVFKFAMLHELIGDAPVLSDASGKAIADYKAKLTEAKALLGDTYGFDEDLLGDADGQGGW